MPSPIVLPFPSISSGSVPYAGQGKFKGYTFLNVDGLWQAYYAGYPVSVPDAQNFYWVAQGSATVDKSAGTVSLLQPPLYNVDMLSSQVVNNPYTKSFSITIGIEFISPGLPNCAGGLIVRDPATGNCTTIQVQQSTISDTFQLAINANHYNQPNTGDATYVSNIGVYCSSFPRFLKMTSDGTTVSFYYGLNPFNMNLLGSEAVYATNPSQIGVFLDNNCAYLISSPQSQINLFSFDLQPK